MLHKEFFGLLFLGFVVWVFLAVTPSQRIEHFCKPVGWAGNGITSVAALVVPSQQENTQRWFDKFEYGCQYLTWRMFYQDDYNKAKAKEQIKAAEGASSPSSASSAASAASKSSN